MLVKNAKKLSKILAVLQIDCIIVGDIIIL